MILSVWLAAGLAAAAVLDPLTAGLTAAALTGVFFWTRHTAYRQFGGMSGDLAGYCISLSELALLICIVLSERIGSLWF